MMLRSRRRRRKRVSSSMLQLLLCRRGRRLLSYFSSALASACLTLVGVCGEVEQVDHAMPLLEEPHVPHFDKNLAEALTKCWSRLSIPDREEHAEQPDAHFFSWIAECLLDYDQDRVGGHDEEVKPQTQSEQVTQESVSDIIIKEEEPFASGIDRHEHLEYLVLNSAVGGRGELEKTAQNLKLLGQSDNYLNKLDMYHSTQHTSSSNLEHMMQEDVDEAVFFNSQ
ncbi:unnamed protein product [Amoebophrya sp. A25]|nr:unnamed protein product [Amoebophrya sp. A25]|eukprot:GSA25T00008541001.1